MKSRNCEAGILSVVAGLSLSCSLHAQPVLVGPRIAPVAPHAGELVMFRLDEDVCGYLSDPPTVQITGNVVSIVETFRVDPLVGCFEPFPLPNDYPIGPFAEGDFVARYTARLDGNIIFGPVDVPFTVAGMPRSIPTLDGFSMALLVLFIAGCALSARNHATDGA